MILGGVHGVVESLFRRYVRQGLRCLQAPAPGGGRSTAAVVRRRRQRPAVQGTATARRGQLWSSAGCARLTADCLCQHPPACRA